jgi:hypothetical protein
MPLLFQERVLHLQLTVPALQLPQPRPLRNPELRLIPGMAFPVCFHPISQGGPIQPELTGNLGDRPGSLRHHPGGFLLELRREITAFLFCHSMPSFPEKILLDPRPGSSWHPRRTRRRCAASSGGSATPSTPRWWPTPGRPQQRPAHRRAREGNRGTSLSPGRPAHTPHTGSSGKPLPGPPPPYGPAPPQVAPRLNRTERFAAGLRTPQPLRRNPAQPLDSNSKEDSFCLPRLRLDRGPAPAQIRTICTRSILWSYSTESQIFGVPAAWLLGTTSPSVISPAPGPRAEPPYLYRPVMQVVR